MQASRSSVCIAAVCWGCFCSPLLSAQTSPTAIVATGGIAGRIVNADGAGPIKGAVVQLSSQRGTRTEISDDRGLYEFSDLPAGSYSVTCARTGFTVVPGTGSSTVSLWRIPSPIRKIELADGQARRDVDIGLSRWSVIAVHVTDDLGHPREGVEVRVLAVTGPGAERRMGRAAVAAANSPNFWVPKEFYTDDRGAVRIYGLSAGNYVVVAEPVGGPLVHSDPDDRERVFPPTFYPGTSSVTEAQALTLHTGEEFSVQVSLVQAQTVSVSGTVVAWNGLPGRAFVVLRRNPAGALYPENTIGDVLARADLVEGRFSFEDVRPGDYLIETSYDSETSERDGEASVAVTVAASDLSGLVLTAVRERRVPK